jgi:hypothetical protein
MSDFSDASRVLEEARDDVVLRWACVEAGVAAQSKLNAPARHQHATRRVPRWDAQMRQPVRSEGDHAAELDPHSITGRLCCVDAIDFI